MQHVEVAELDNKQRSAYRNRTRVLSIPKTFETSSPTPRSPSDQDLKSDPPVPVPYTLEVNGACGGGGAWQQAKTCTSR